jgi:hypothetical protein
MWRTAASCASWRPAISWSRPTFRNYLEGLRAAGERTGGPAALDTTDRKRFADQLDRFLAKQKR